MRIGLMILAAIVVGLAVGTGTAALRLAWVPCRDI